MTRSAALTVAKKVAKARKPSSTSLQGGPDNESLNYILAMTHELKNLARKSRFLRVALILELAELEALDQRNKKDPRKHSS